MTIRTRISIYFTLITASILLISVLVIYYSASSTREKEFYRVLKKEALTKANLFFNARVPSATLQNIHKNNRQLLNEVEVAIYDTAFNLLYHDAIETDFIKENRKMIDRILRKGEIRFRIGKAQAVGIRYVYQNRRYLVTAVANDLYGYSKLTSLLKNSLLVFVISVLFIYIAGRQFSRKAFEPIRDMTARAASISATNLGMRLKDDGNRDELAELAKTFNEMLDRLENSFEAQKHFVSNISHELRTPLAAIIAEMELSANRERRIEEYKAAIRNVLTDARKLVRLSNSLLDFAKASYDPSEIAFRPVRIDELLLDARQQVQQAGKAYKIAIRFENDFENDERISVYGNEYLLKVAFVNLLENGCKFSNGHRCDVSVSFGREQIILNFEDQGVGISSSDLDRIFEPFYRGENRNFTDGNGIGLSLTHKIILLHKGQIDVRSEKGKGTVFTLRLRHL